MRDRDRAALGTNLYESLLDVINKVIGEADLALSPQNRLRGSLASVLRIKKGRLRIFFLASVQKQKAIVLFFGYRREGHKGDAYAELERMIRKGTFDPQFAELEIPRPDV